MNNTLFYGDNLEVLRKYVPTESVDLCYCDPPFNSKRNYNQIYNNVGTEDRAQAQAFVDTWTWDEHAEAGFGEILANDVGRFTPQTVELIKGLHLVLKKGSLLAYLVSMTLRVVEIHRVLKSTGSFYLHCDPTSSHYLKLVLDTVFVPAGGDYRNEIIWKRKAGRGETQNAAVKFGVSHDIIFFYVKDNKTPLKRQFRPNNQHYLDSKFTHLDATGRRYRLDNLTSPSPRPNLTYEYKGYAPPANGWAVSRERMEQMEAEGRLHFPKSFSQRIQRKRFLDELEGETVDDLWDDIPPINSQAQERLGYPTQKPEALLERILQASTNPGDTVLDAYCGCGTTIAVAQRLNRKWIGIDITYQSISLILRRLEGQFGPEVLKTITLNGIPKDMASAQALALKKDDRTRKEFEKWAVLTFTNNRAVINTKKGADGGVDGIAYSRTGHDTNAKVMLQVKSGGVQRNDIAALRGDMAKEGAEMAVFLTLQEPTKPMLKDAADAGTFLHPLMGKSYPRIEVVTVAEMVEQGRRLDLPLGLAVVKDAQKAAAEAHPALDMDV